MEVGEMIASDTKIARVFREPGRGRLSPAAA